MASPKANSWNALRPGESAAVKKRAGLNVEKDYTLDPACLSCHSVGFGKPGGYFIPDLSDEKLARTAATREGVGCESCHGPGSGFVEIMRDVVRRERTYRPEEVYALGRKIVGPEVCYECHNDKAICMISPDGSRHHRASRSQIEALDRRGFHKKFPFKFREPEAIAPEPAQRGAQSNNN